MFINYNYDVYDEPEYVVIQFMSTSIRHEMSSMGPRQILSYTVGLSSSVIGLCACEYANNVLKYGTYNLILNSAVLLLIVENLSSVVT